MEAQEAMTAKSFRQQYGNSLSKCWSCLKAVPHGAFGCPWSLEAKPIKGWNAIPVIHTAKAHGYVRDIVAYHVIDCPQFAAEDRRKRR